MKPIDMLGNRPWIIRMIVSVVLILLTSMISAQTPQFEWAAQMSSSGLVEAYTVDVDMDGNVITMGYFTSETDFDPGPGETLLTPQGGADIFLQKLDSLGDLVWVRQIGGDGLDGALVLPPPIFDISGIGGGLSVDAENNIYVTGGISSDSIDLDPGSGFAYAYSENRFVDGLLLKLSPSGDLIWGFTFGENGLDFGSGCEIDLDGNVLVHGTFSDTVDFDPSQSGEAFLIGQNQYGEGAFVLKLDVNGGLIWVNQPPQEVKDVVLDQEDNIYIAGRFRDSADFDLGVDNHTITTANSGSIYLLKLNDDGEFDRVEVFHGNAGGFGEGVGALSVDGLNNIWLASHFAGAVDIDPSLPGTHLIHSDSGQYFIVKLSSTGDMLFAGQSDLHIFDLVNDVQGNLYGIGVINESSFDADPSLAYAGFNVVGDGIFVLKITDDGNLDWFHVLDTTYPHLGYGLSIELDALKKVYSAGGFVRSGDFDPSSTSDFFLSSANSPWPDGFVAKWSQLDTAVGVTEVLKREGGVLVYPNPASDGVRIASQHQADSRIQVNDVLGRTMYMNTIDATSTHDLTVDVSHWENGVYMFMIDQNENRQVIRVVKH